MTLKPEHARIAGYFNMDNGGGAIRGVYLQGNDAVRPVFAAWMEPLRSLGMTTLSIRSTGSHRSQSHSTRSACPASSSSRIRSSTARDSHHTNNDVYERVQPEDLMKNAAIVASFVYHAAVRDELLPRKPLPRPRPRPARHAVRPACRWPSRCSSPLPPPRSPISSPAHSPPASWPTPAPTSAGELAAARQDNQWLRHELERQQASLGGTQALLDKAELNLRDAFRSLAAEALEQQPRRLSRPRPHRLRGAHQAVHGADGRPASRRSTRWCSRSPTR